MLESIYIKNFILLEDVKLDFKDGFNVLCGETGAGKSIIIKALDCVLGAKITKEMILDKNSPCLIEAVFKENGKETIISRETLQTSKYRLNGILSSQDEIKELRENLLDIHSQHQTYSYISAKTHIHLLDSYIQKIKPEYKELLEQHKNSFLEFKKVEKKLNDLRENLENNSREIELLEFQLKELDDAAILKNEEEDLKNEIDVLSNVQHLKDTSYSSYWALYGDNQSIVEALSKIKYEISNIAELDKSLEDVKNSIYDAYETLKDSASFLSDYSSNLELNPNKLDELNERISLIQKLKRKYGLDLDEEREKIAKRLQELTSGENNIDELEKKYEIIKETVDFTAKKIQELRLDFAEKLQVLIEEKLHNLEIKNAVFEISITDTSINEYGIDNVEFLISTNASQKPMPLNKIASGGEISRIMLAMKTIFAMADKIQTVVFDEIDTGISGVTSNSVAQNLIELSKSTQILCITHQPIIAAKANNFIWVTKKDKTNVEIFNDDRRIKALAQLAGGTINDKAIEFAKVLIE